MEFALRGARAACAGLVLFVAACGGGGGGGGGAPDLSTAPGITVAPTSLSFAAVHNGALPPTQNISITISAPNAVFVGAAFPGAPSWLDKSQARLTGGGNNWTFTAAITSTFLTPGTYSTTMQIGIADANQNIIAYRNVQISYTITATPVAASPNSLNFSYVVGGPAPAAQQTTLMGDTNTFIGSADQPWISVTPSGVVPGTATISVNPAGLTPNPNPYTGTVTFFSGTSMAPVSVSLTVSAPDIQSSQASLSFSGINGATIAAQPLAITMNNGAALSWTASTPLPDTWLLLDRASGTQADSLNVSVNPANGPLASGTYNSSITLQGTSGGQPFNKTVNVSLTLTKATLTPNPVSVTLGGTNGRDFSGVPVQLSLNTGASSFLWNSSGTSSFVNPAPVSGSVSGTPVSVTLTPVLTGLTGGTHSGTAKFTAAVNGDQVTVNVPVTFNMESHKLLVDGNGVALVKTPSFSRLTRTLVVRDNLGLTTNWTATSDRPWLTVTGSGLTGVNSMLLSADTSTLAADSLNFATVTIGSSDTSVENAGTEKVRVGLWVGSADPTSNSIGVNALVIAADPIRPYAYAAVGSDINVYNIYTGAPVNTITGVAAGGGTIEAMIASHDGSTLYALDSTNSKIVRVDLDAQTVSTSFSVSVVNPVRILDYTRTNGVEVIASSSSGQIFDAQTGTLFPSTFVGNTVVSMSRGGTRLCTVDVGISLYSVSCPTLDFTSLNGGQLLLGNTFEISGIGSNGQDAIVKDDGSIFYVAAGAPAELSAYQTSGQNPTYLGAGQSPAPIGAHPNNVEIAPDGRILGSSQFGTGADVWIFNADGTPYSIPTLQVATVFGDVIVGRQLRISGDGVRLITLTNGPVPSGLKVNFTSIP
jgi:hypothetical protein